MRSPQLYKTILPLLLIPAGLGLVSCGQERVSEDIIETRWQTSAHADAQAPAFSAFALWGDGDPTLVPKGCARCHSTQGYLDFVGADGSEAGTVNQAPPSGSVIECDVCHNEVTEKTNRAIMPSGVELTDLGENTDCMACHQGRASTHSVDAALTGLADDQVNHDLRFISLHNNAAGAVLYGSQAQGGYEYEGEVYLGRYDHALELNTCIACHDSHTLAIDARVCAACHLGVESTDDLVNIRLTNADFDGDGDTSEGVAAEIKTLIDVLLRAMQSYAARTKGLDLIVHQAYQPYFFNEADQPYRTWTPRLLRAAYNYQFVNASPGGYAHNPKYMIQLLYDSLADLGAKARVFTRP